ncbi:MAG: alkaline phosphatase family protein [Nitrospiraceae bacterium]|nr:MAG: alkaline phosphatase family protein [Nitrospiraceae bacterium]
MQIRIVWLCLAFFLATASHALDDWKPLPDGEVTRIAFGSCAKQWQHQTIWNAVLATKPDLWLFLGDNIYGDTDGRTAWLVSKEQITGEWNRLADKPEFQKARETIPMMATWDNHDYGSHAGGAEFPVKERTKEAFLTFWGEPKDSPRWQRSGIYDAKIFGPPGRQVKVILLDTKYNRSPFKPDPTPKEERSKASKVGGYIPDNDPAKTHLGAEQWAWLEQELKKPAEVRLIASSTQVIPNQKGMDEWGNFPLERQRLFDLIKKTKANGVILLSGNVHFAELSQNSEAAYPLYELTSSGMTHVNEFYGKATNSFRIAGPFIEHNFGLVDIDWNAQPSPTITLSAVGEDGAIAFEHKVRMADIQHGSSSEIKR